MTSTTQQRLVEKCNEKAERVGSLLANEPGFWDKLRSPSADPELRKTLGRIYVALHDVVSLREAIEEQGCTTLILDLLDQFDPEQTSLDQALEVADRLDELLIKSCDPLFLRTGLVAESSYEGGTALAWNEVYKDFAVSDGYADIMELIRRLDRKEDGATDCAERLLLGLKSARTHKYRRDRARLKLKTKHLLLSTPVMATLLVLLGLFLWIDSLPLDNVVLVAVAGAAGGSIAGMFKLRDELRFGSDLREFAPAIAIQPLIGGVAALFLLMALESNILNLTESDGILSRATFGFLAGFSEPLFLGVANRIASISAPR